MLRALFTVCGGEVTRPGIIETINYMGRYSEEANCTWNITAPPGQVIVLR
jgi:CUB domain.